MIRTSVRISGLTSDRGSYGLRYGFGPWFVRFRSVVRTVSVRGSYGFGTVSSRGSCGVGTVSFRGSYYFGTVSFRDL